MKKQTHRIVILIITVVFISFLISPNLFLESDTRSNFDYSPPNAANGGDSPIQISNNSELALWSTSGDGNSWETAYIIQNLNIFTDNTTDALLIGNTTKFCIVQNCSFMNLFDGQEFSLRIKNSSNIRILNNSAYHSKYGITVLDSENIEISKNFLFNHSTSLFLVNISNTEITNNVLLEYTWQGLTILSNSRDILISNNIYQGSEYFQLIIPIDMYNVTNFTIRNEFIPDILRCFFIECSSFSIENSTFSEVYISRSQDFFIQHCVIASTIDFVDCLAFNFTGNTIVGTDNYRNHAIGLNCCYNYNVTQNRINNYRKYAIRISGNYEGEIPDHQPDESVERIENNIIRWKGLALIEYSIHWKSSSAYEARIRSQKLGWNWVIPPVSYIVMCVIIVAVVFLLMRTKYKFSSINRKLGRTENQSFNLILSSQRFFYDKLVRMGLIFGGILIPLTLIHIYSDTGWFSLFYDSIYDFNPSNILEWRYYTLGEFIASQTVISIIWGVFFIIYLLTTLIYTRTPKMLRKKRPKIYGFQIRNIVLVTIGVVILLIIQSIFMVYGLWIYLGYFYSVLLLGGFLWFGFSKSFDRKNRYMWKFLIGFVLLIVSHIIIHTISTTELWDSDIDPVIISLQFLRGAILVVTIIKWGDYK